MDSDRIFLWIAFNVFVLGMLAIDLGVFHRKAHSVSIKEATTWSVVWVSLAMLFNLGIYFAWGQEKALEFLTGYVIEKSLSVDNLFVFLMIFQYFATPAEYQHRILFWGILGALVLRAIFIAAGAALIGNFHWMIYVFGAFLVFTGVKMFLQGEEKLEPQRNPVVRLFERWMPISKRYHGQKFFIRDGGKTQATLLMVVLIVIETTDVIFAVDSIPAIFAITQDPFIVYTSNVFAILGLRALYFMLAGAMEMFTYLKVGLSLVLAFVGTKMMLVDVYKIPIGASLGVIGAVLALSVIASLAMQPRRTAKLPASSEKEKVSVLKGMLGRQSPFAYLGAIWAAILATLVAVKWHSIAGGPTSNEAIVAIRVVEVELEHAQQRAEGTDANLRNAGIKLDSAWANLEQKDYQQAIIDAQEADRILGARPD